jgi:hypothetical protein
LLKKDSKAIAAFRMMNTAMFMQLHHSILKKNKDEILKTKLTEQYYKDVDADYKWRSFQIAFILLNIDAFVKPDIDDKTVENIFSKGWPERNEIADLVWFPTGGGKTEAYLGIIAFVIGYRRFIKGAEGEWNNCSNEIYFAFIDSSTISKGDTSYLCFRGYKKG